jgi:hypothetical protein
MLPYRLGDILAFRGSYAWTTLFAFILSACVLFGFDKQCTTFDVVDLILSPHSWTSTLEWTVHCILALSFKARAAACPSASIEDVQPDATNPTNDNVNINRHSMNCFVVLPLSIGYYVDRHHYANLVYYCVRSSLLRC